MVMNGQENQTWLTLNNGVRMPQFGLGVYSIPAGDVTYNSVKTALECGYRHIDTPMPTRTSRVWARPLLQHALRGSEEVVHAVESDGLISTGKVRERQDNDGLG